MTLQVNREQAFATKPEVVIFDLDDTLYAYDPAHQAALAAAEHKVCALLGTDARQFRKNFETARQTVKNRLKGSASSHSRLLYFQTLLEQMGLESQILMSLDLEQTYWRTFLSTAKLFPDVKEWLRDLHADGIKTALITDLTAQIQFRKLIYFGLDQHFDLVVTSEEAGADKSSGAPFDLIIQKLALTEPEKAWMIGDNPIADIEGGRAAGMVTLQTVHGGVEHSRRSSQADLKFEHFIDLRRFFSKRFGVGQVPSIFAVATGAPEARHA